MPGHKDNTNALKHGGSAARSALSKNEEFTGVAREAEQKVREELEAHDGRLSVVTRAVARLQATADLYWNALVDAGEQGDAKRLASYAKSFGWIQSKALSALQQLRDEQESAGNTIDYEVIIQAERDSSQDGS
jgi:hypothetical protein